MTDNPLEIRPVKTAKGHAYLGGKEFNKARMSGSRLVAEEEQVDHLAAECLGLMPELRMPILELIRLARYQQEGLDKRRLLSDARGSGNNENPPGNTRIAGAVRQYGRELTRMSSLKRQQRKRFIDDLKRLKAEHLARLDAIEGWMDPDRFAERRAKRAEKAKSVTLANPAAS